MSSASSQPNYTLSDREKTLIYELHQSYITRTIPEAPGRRGLTVNNPPVNPSQRFKDETGFIHALFDQYGKDPHEFLNENPEEASGFLVWRKSIVATRCNDDGEPEGRYLHLPDIPEIKDTFQQYVDSADAALKSDYEAYNIIVPE